MKPVRYDHLKSGRIQSCGCLWAEGKGTWSTTHGGSHTRIYKIWSRMRSRCSTPTDGDFPAYGGRGITVCIEWEDFPTFRQWAMDSGYAPQLTLDRIDNDDSYRPGNCRWATPKQQARNTRRNRLITAFGETKPMTVWMDDPRYCGVTAQNLLKRLNLKGMPPEVALTLPPRTRWQTS